MVVHIHNTGCYFCVSVVDKLFSISYGEESGAKDIFRAEFRMTPLTPEVHLCSMMELPSLLSLVEILVVAGRVEGMKD